MKNTFDTIERGFEGIELYRAASIVYSGPNLRIFKPALVSIGIAIILSASLVQAPFLQLVRAQSTSIDLSQEYSSGDLQVDQYIQAWYSWVNVNGTRTIFLALHSQQYNSPVFAFVGQAYSAPSGARVFVANALLATEVYNDTNSNGYLDADYSAGTTELLYTLILNSSQTFASSPVQRTSVDGAPHYLWGITYGAVDAILINAVPPGYGYGGGMVASFTIIDHVSMFYDYSVQGNTAFLKTSYEIGNVTLVAPTGPDVTLQGLSLSLLHATLTVSSTQLDVLAGNASYDSQVNTTPSLVNAAEVRVEGAVAFEFRFKDNYTLQTNPPVSYPAVYLASPAGSLPPDAFQGQWFSPIVRVQDYVKGLLPDIAGLPATSDFNYATSRFIYRVSYPTWSGYALTHDPTYVAHFVPGSSFSSLPVATLSAAIFTGVLSLVIAVQGLARRRKRGQVADEPQDLGSSSD